MDDREIIMNACALIEATGPKGRATGSAYLVEASTAVTCAHILTECGLGVGDRATLRFPNGERAAEVLDVDADTDFALLGLTSPLTDRRPLSFAATAQVDAEWKAYGFPKQTNGEGLWIEGKVANATGKDPLGKPAYQLYCAAADDGARLKGFSGAPVLVRGQVIGHFKRILSDEDARGRATLHTLYACPGAAAYVALGGRLAAAPRSPRAPGTAYDETWYVHREDQERRALLSLQSGGKAAVLWGPQKMGKTTLMRFLFDAVRRDSALGPAEHDGGPPLQPLIIEANIASYDSDSLEDLGTLLRQATEDIAQKANVASSVVDECWQSRGDQKTRFTKFLSTLLDRDPKRIIILAFERLDTLSKQTYLEELFGYLKFLADKSFGAWARLRVVIEVSTTPTLLTEKPCRFNSANPIQVKAFRVDQLTRLADLYGVRLTDDQKAELLKQTGGHPFLLQTAVYELCLQPGTSIESILTEARTNGGGIFSQYVIELIELVSRPSKDRLLSILRDPRVPPDPSVDYRLIEAGIIERDAEGYRLACPLFRQTFLQACEA